MLFICRFHHRVLGIGKLSTTFDCEFDLFYLGLEEFHTDVLFIAGRLIALGNDPNLWDRMLPGSTSIISSLCLP